MKTTPLIVAALIQGSRASTTSIPTTGRFFYSDFLLDSNSGLHEMNLMVGDDQHFFSQLNTVTPSSGVITKDCRECKNLRQYDGSSATKVSKQTEIEEFQMFDGTEIKEASFEGLYYSDKWTLFFQKYKREVEIPI